MEFHTGRLIDHVHLRAKNFEVTRAFYQSVLGVLGFSTTASGKDWMQIDELFIDKADIGSSASHVHLAFQAQDKAMVDAFHKAALNAGGRDNGAPGERAYHPNYYGAFVFDPDGNNIEAVWHGPSSRSADSVVIRPLF